MNVRWRAVAYEAARRNEWDAFVSTSRAPHFLFLRDYMDYHSDRFEDASLLLYDGTRLAALLPANREGDAVRSHGGITFGGFVTDDKMTAHGMMESFAATAELLRSEGIQRLVYAPVPHIYHEVPAEEDLYALFRYGARLSQRDLSSTIDFNRRPRMSKGRRATTKRAAVEGFTIEQSSAFAEFMELDAAMLEERYGVSPTHTGDELTKLAARFPTSIRLFVASDGADQLAGVVIYETSRVAHAQYIAASEEGRNRGATDAVLAYLLDDVYGGKRYFDFGISTERNGAHLNAGLVRNKESFGARGVAYDRYELDL
jgi:GNAT acetyltransferase-like protein